MSVNLASLDDWDIVVDAAAIPSEVYAAQEFCDHFERASNVSLPIVTSTERPDRHIFIGESPPMRQSRVGFEPAKMGDEDLRIVVRDRNIAIAGGRPRGTLYGVYTFLEDHLGVRFLTHDHTHVPPVGEWRAIGPIDQSYHPPLGFRWPFYGETNRNENFAARLRCNTVTRDQKLGGITSTILINHTFDHLVPTATYGRTHPEYYCLIDGKRRGDVEDPFGGKGNEPCLTNPDVLRIVTQSTLDEIKRHPECANVSVTQNDNDLNCRCEDCARLDDREGTPMGSLLTFVNAVADEVAAKHPDVKVGTLAYWYSRKAPRTIKPQDNVMIQLASIECSMFQPINDPDSKLNTDFCGDLEQWSRICSDISIWNYNTNFHNYLLPCPNLRIIESNIRFFVAHNARGIFMQAAGDALGAEFSDLRNYVMARLLWNPNLSGERLIDEFVSLHYASAAPPIRRYIDLVHDTVASNGIEKNCFASAAEHGIDPSVVKAGLKAFDEAARLADNADVRRRVEKASVCAYRAAIEDAWVWAKAHEEKLPGAAMPKRIAKRTRPHARRLFELCEAHGVTHWHEGYPLAEARDLLRKAYGLSEDESF